MICVNSVCVSPKSITLKVGSWSYAARAEVCPSNADCKEVTWHSNNPSVASVNAASGYIYANATGTARIYATATDGSGCSDYLTVTVSNNISVSAVALNFACLSLEEGQSACLCAIVYPDNATNKNVNWTSANSNVATVCNGVVTAVAIGSTCITATAADGSGKSASCAVVVTEDVMVSSICISPDTKTMIAGKSAYFYATVCPPNATNCGVTWSSDDTTVATVNSFSGLVYAQKAGSTVIRATACDGSGKYGECVITVNPPVFVTDITVYPESLTMEVGETKTLNVGICPENATNKRVTWRSSKENVAYVDYYTGEIYANDVGTAIITATTEDGDLKSCGTGYSL